MSESGSSSPGTGGIWDHASLFDDGGGPARRATAGKLTLREGGTALQDAPSLAAQLGLGSLLLKREDQNPSGSHKDRGLLYQVVRHAESGQKTFVLSSSGNAAVSAAAACRITGSRLVAFVAPGTSPAKLARLLESDATVVECSKPINFARYAARVFGLQNLRGTTDPSASIGYRSLAAEITKEAPSLDALFTFSSSGISMEGIADGLGMLGQRLPLWAVQSGECVGLVRVLDPDVVGDPESPAGRLGIRNPPGAAALSQRLLDSGGGAVAVGAAEVRSWMDQLESAGVHTSPEGGAVLAGIAATPGLAGKRVAAIMTGRASGAAAPSPDRAPLSASSYLDVRALFVERLGLEPL